MPKITSTSAGMSSSGVTWPPHWLKRRVGFAQAWQGRGLLTSSVRVVTGLSARRAQSQPLVAGGHSMAMLPTRRSGQSLTIVDPSREFEDIYNRMGQLMDLALGDFAMPRDGNMPWTPFADVVENDDGYEI